jgi:hypothetical protein
MVVPMLWQAELHSMFYQFSLQPGLPPRVGDELLLLFLILFLIDYVVLAG